MAQGSFRLRIRREARTSVAFSHTCTVRQGLVQGAWRRPFTPSASGVRRVEKVNVLSSRSRLAVG